MKSTRVCSAWNCQATWGIISIPCPSCLCNNTYHTCKIIIHFFTWFIWDIGCYYIHWFHRIWSGGQSDCYNPPNSNRLTLWLLVSQGKTLLVWMLSVAFMWWSYTTCSSVSYYLSYYFSSYYPLRVDRELLFFICNFYMHWFQKTNTCFTFIVPLRLYSTPSLNSWFPVLFYLLTPIS